VARVKSLAGRDPPFPGPEEPLGRQFRGQCGKEGVEAIGRQRTRLTVLERELIGRCPYIQIALAKESGSYVFNLLPPVSIMQIRLHIAKNVRSFLLVGRGRK
jgi:hypothetical protein